MAGTITIINAGITQLDTDAVVNAANKGLYAGGGVCGAIFRDAGHNELEAACRVIGHCDTGSAVITPGFRLKAKYIIHAVGPIWYGGMHDEEQLLYSAYQRSLDLALQNQCHSIGFPLISAGIYGCPKDIAWNNALHAFNDFLSEHPDYDMQIVFAVPDPAARRMGEEQLNLL